MRGFLRRAVPLWFRRAVTMLPALVVAAAGINATHALVLSQVVLSFGIPAVLIPLAWLTSQRSVMGQFRNSTATSAVIWSLVALIAGLNLFLLAQVVVG